MYDGYADYSDGLPTCGRLYCLTIAEKAAAAVLSLVKSNDATHCNNRNSHFGGGSLESVLGEACFVACLGKSGGSWDAHCGHALHEICCLLGKVGWDSLF